MGAGGNAALSLHLSATTCLLSYMLMCRYQAFISERWPVQLAVE